MNDESGKESKKKKMVCCQKNLKRIFRRCAAMTKIAAMMLVFIFVYGVLETNIEVSEEIRGVADLNVHQLSRRQVMQVHAEFNDITTSMQPTPVAKQSEGDLVVRMSNRKATKANDGAKDSANQELAKKIPPKTLGNDPVSSNINYNMMTTKDYITKEKDNQLSWSKKIKRKRFPQEPPNPSFIFHNKLPKSGSSTMNNILKKLSKQNSFNFLKVETTTFDVQTLDDNYLINFLEGKIKEPFLLLKHHRFLNFTESNHPQPTYINVIRDPLEWFTSHYYFSRYGWERKPGCRKADCGMSKEDRFMEIDECVKKRHHECMNPWKYLQFFCGTAPECYDISTLEQKKKATEIAKANILEEYYFVGILEQFEDSLRVLDAILPNYFKSAVTVWKSDFVQEKQNMTRTTYKREMSEESKKFFRDGPLHFEIELYNFARELFNERLRQLNMKPTISV